MVVDKLFRAAIALLLLLGVFQAYRITRSERSPGALDPVAIVDLGSVLRDVRLDVIGDGLLAESVRVRSPRLHSMVAGQCGIVIAFASNCPGARDMAPKWRGIRSIKRGHLDMPVAWLDVVPRDTGAVRYLRENGIAEYAFALRSESDRNILGFRAWPMILVIGRGGRLLARPGVYPEDVKAFPEECGDIP